jgi:hypothetical protein
MSGYPLRDQLDMFIIKPLHEVAFLSPVLIVMDALDECGTEQERHDLLEAIEKDLPNPPSFLKVLITSRPERDIRAKIGTGSFSKNINQVAGVDDDILTYVNNQMHDIIKYHPTTLKADWPGPDVKCQLCSRAAGLFIWITVASRYIGENLDPEQALEDVLNGETVNADGEGPEAILDDLYLGILQRVSALKHSNNATAYVVGSILVAKYPLTSKTLVSLLGLGKNTLQHPIKLRDGSQIRLTSSASLIGALASILLYDANGVRFLHASIGDFFTRSSRRTDKCFFIDTDKYNCELTIRCFNTVDALKRDICAINDPTKLNPEVLDLNTRLQEYLPEHVRYACRSWYRHLANVTDDDMETYDQAKA